MTLPNILMAVGIVCIVLSFLIKDRTKKIEKDVEDLSINIYQETNALKRRLKVVEEELLLDTPIKMPKKAQQAYQQPIQPNIVSPNNTAAKPINSILVSQVLALSKQGLTIEEIQKRSALSKEQIIHIIRNGGQ
jgi:hypothetical protein